MEISVIGRLLKKARRWHVVASEIKPLKQAVSCVGRALQPQEKKKLLETASANPEWLVVRCAAQLALNTTMRGCELKHLRWKNVNFNEGLVHLERSKTHAGLRTIPLNKAALQAFSELWDRAKKLSST